TAASCCLTLTEVADLLKSRFHLGPQRFFLIGGQCDVYLGLQKGFDRFHRIDGVDSRKHLVSTAAREVAATAATLIFPEGRQCGQQRQEHPKCSSHRFVARTSFLKIKPYACFNLPRITRAVREAEVW